MALFNLSRHSRSAESTEDFLNSVRLSGFTDEETTYIRDLIKRLAESGLPDQFDLVNKYNISERLVLPYFSDMTLIQNFRVLTSESGKREIVSLIELEFQLSYSDNTIDRVRCQLSPEDLGHVINRLNNFKTQIQQEREYISKSGMENKG